jgi:hypothetical protein
MARPLVQVKGMHKIFDADENGQPITSDFKESFKTSYVNTGKVDYNTLIWIDCDGQDTNIFDSMYSAGYTYTYAHGTLYNSSGRTIWYIRELPPPIQY